MQGSRPRHRRPPGFAAAEPAARRRFHCLAVLLALGLVALASALAGAPARAEEHATVTLLSTTDLHGHLLPEEDYTGAPAPRGLARVATLVARVRAEDPRALLLDDGDCISGSPLEIAQHAQATGRPDPMMAAMNLLRYDAMAVGNHEFDHGRAALEAARREAKFPWLCANTLRHGAPAFGDPYCVFEVRGVRVGVLGLTTPATASRLDREEYSDLETGDAVEAARRWVPILRDRERCDAVVVLAHMGLERDPTGGREIPGQEKGENEAYALASEVPGVDVVILGHTHRVLASATVKDVLLTQAGQSGEGLGKIELRFTRPTPQDRWQIAGKRAELLPVTADTPPDSALMALAVPYRAAARAWLDQPLGKSEGLFDAGGGRLRDSALGDLVLAAELKYGEADVALAALPDPGARIAPGAVRMRDVASLFPYENRLVTLEVTGGQLRAALEHAVEGLATYDPGNADRPAAPEAPESRLDAAAGVDYVVDLTAPAGQRVKDLRYLGRPLEDSRPLRLAVDSYRAAGGGGYAVLRDAKGTRRTGAGMRDLLARYVREARGLRPRTDGNWRIVPAFALDPAREPFERLTRRGVWTPGEARAMDPAAPLTRAQFAGWLAAAYGARDSAGLTADRRDKTQFLDLPSEWIAPVARAAATGAFAGLRGTLLRPLDRLDLLSAVDWMAHAATRGSVPQPPPATPPADVRAPVVAPPAPIPPLLRPRSAPPGYGRARLPLAVERYAADGGFLDEWDPAADPAALTVADGVRLLAAARYPLVTILWTTDFHGAFEPRERDRGRMVGSSAVLAAYLARERARNPRGTLLMDGGDMFQGTMLSNLSFGRSVIAQMNRLGYDAAAVGNHDFDWSADTLVARMREARFPFLSANLVERERGRAPPWIQPYAIFERHGVKIAVLGFSTLETPTTTMPRNVARFEFRPEADIARRRLPELRAQGADVLVVIGHLPGSQDSTGTVFRGELADLGRDISGEDALLGGHSHTYVNGKLGGVPILIAASQARAVGRVDLVVDRVAHRVVESRSRLVSTYADAIAPDAAMAAFVDSLARAIAPLAGRELCLAPQALTRDRRAESTLGDWVADVMRARAGADVALTNPGGLRTDIDAGPVTVRNIFELMPFDNRIAVVRLTGAQLLDVVEHGVAGGSCPQVSGIRFSFDTTRPARERVVRLTLADGRPLDPGGEYLVATNDFMAQGGDGYTVLAQGKDPRVTDVLIRDALVADCEARGKRGEPLVVKLDGRVLPTATPPPVDHEPRPVGAPKR